MLSNNITLAFKKEALHKKRVSQFRQTYKKEIRKMFLQEKSSNHYFQSETLEGFNFLQDDSKIQTYFSQIFNILQQLPIEEMSDEQADNLARDLLYLIIEKEFICPYQLKLKKNQSNISALVISFVADNIDPQQLRCWINFMDQQLRIVMYLGIKVQNFSSRIWVQEHPFVQQLFADWDLQQASNLIYDLLTQKFYVNQQFIHLVTQNLITKIQKILHNHLNISFFESEMKILIYLIRLFMKNQSLGTRNLRFCLDELIQKFTQVQLAKIFTQNTVCELQKYMQQMSNLHQIPLIQQNFTKLIKILVENNLKKGQYILIKNNRTVQKIFLVNSTFILNIVLQYFRVTNLRKTGFKIHDKQILQKLNPQNLKKELTQENLEPQLQLLESYYTKILNYQKTQIKN